MLDEARKREKAANALLGLAFAASAAQSPKDFVKTGSMESPGAALMQTWARKRGEAERNLDSGRVSHSARNRKMKTFKEFVEEAYLIEMRKEDKVAGKQKTPLHTIVKSASVKRQPEGSSTKWKVEKSERKTVSREASLGRTKQGMIDKATNPYASRYEVLGTYKRHGHGGGGSGAEAPGKLRGVKRTQTIQQRRERGFGEGPSPAEKVALRRRMTAGYSGRDN
jgi:hypothetical protein